MIASQGDLDLSRLGKLADELLPYLTKSVMSVPPPQMHNGNNQSSKSSVPVGIRPFKSNQRPKVCRSHLYFGKDAKYCKPWCQWPNKAANISVQPSSRPSSPSPSGN